MKVYVMTSRETISEYVQLLEVFDRPKTARLWLDARYGIVTKGKWTKLDTGVRYYVHDGYYYYLSERTFKKGKLEG